MTDCETVLRQIWDYLDDELSASDRAEIERHIRACHHCFDVARFDAAFLGRLRDVKAQPLIIEELRQRLIRQMREEGMPPPSRKGE